MRCPKVNKLRTAARRRLMLEAALALLQAGDPASSCRSARVRAASGRSPVQAQAGGHIAGIGPLRMRLNCSRPATGRSGVHRRARPTDPAAAPVTCPEAGRFLAREQGTVGARPIIL